MHKVESLSNKRDKASLKTLKDKAIIRDLNTIKFRHNLTQETLENIKIRVNVANGLQKAKSQISRSVR